MDASTHATPWFAIQPGYAVYRGPTTGAGPLHRHGAFQVAVGQRGDVAMDDAHGTRHRAAALVVTPMASHRIHASTDLLTFFIEPHCAFADLLRRDHRDGVSPAPEFRGLTVADVAEATRAPSAELDPRLTHAMNMISARDASMSHVAAAVGLSAQRLRSLARSQLGMPLTRWRTWVRLGAAAEAMRSGSSVTEAAGAAGFSDQAHLTRRMREMMGLTPAAVLPILLGQGLRAT